MGGPGHLAADAHQQSICITYWYVQGVWLAAGPTGLGSLRTGSSREIRVSVPDSSRASAQMGPLLGLELRHMHYELAEASA